MKLHRQHHRQAIKGNRARRLDNDLSELKEVNTFAISQNVLYFILLVYTVVWLVILLLVFKKDWFQKLHHKYSSVCKQWRKPRFKGSGKAKKSLSAKRTECRCDYQQLAHQSDSETSGSRCANSLTIERAENVVEERPIADGKYSLFQSKDRPKYEESHVKPANHKVTMNSTMNRQKPTYQQQNTNQMNLKEKTVERKSPYGDFIRHNFSPGALLEKDYRHYMKNAVEKESPPLDSNEKTSNRLNSETVPIDVEDSLNSIIFDPQFMNEGREYSNHILTDKPHAIPSNTPDHFHETFSLSESTLLQQQSPSQSDQPISAETDVKIKEEPPPLLANQTPAHFDNTITSSFVTSLQKNQSFDSLQQELPMDGRSNQELDNRNSLTEMIRPKVANGTEYEQQVQHIRTRLERAKSNLSQLEKIYSDPKVEQKLIEKEAKSDQGQNKSTADSIKATNEQKIDSKIESKSELKPLPPINYEQVSDLNEKIMFTCQSSDQKRMKTIKELEMKPLRLLSDRNAKSKRSAIPKIINSKTKDKKAVNPAFLCKKSHRSNSEPTLKGVRKPRNRDELLEKMFEKAMAKK